jgi:tRNA G18 (ribose-2'-O)-methylase SpoU
VSAVYCTGYTPYPEISGDTRLPHITRKITSAMRKTALGAEKSMTVHYRDQLPDAISEARTAGYRIIALEQNTSSVPLESVHATNKIALVVGNERDGISAEVLSMCNVICEIPMFGSKESLNVSVATGIALHWLRTIA